jgi:hypothetical protein
VEVRAPTFGTITDDRCGMDFRNAEKLSRRVPRRLSYSGYAADFLIGRPIATVLSTV